MAKSNPHTGIKLTTFAKRGSAFQDGNPLESIQLSNVRLGELIGSGTFSNVYEVKVDFSCGIVTKCAGKQIRGRKECLPGKSSYLSRLKDVCVSWWQPGRKKVQHPNLVDFVGMWLHSRFQLPLLITERMETSLFQFLRSTDIEEKKQLTLLRDVACGLDYLHSRKDPIVHGDLTANTVLINRNPTLVAKISDLGLCIILNEGVCPTCPSYRAPKAWKSNHEPCIPDDLYANGVFMVYTLLQEYPESRAREDLDRYSGYLERLKDHRLHDWIAACLNSESSQRPPMNAMLRAIEGVLEGKTPRFTSQLNESDIYPLATATGLDEMELRLRLQVSTSSKCYGGTMKI